MNDDSILSNIQSGFRVVRSCSTTLLNITDDLLRVAEKDKHTFQVLLDFSSLWHYKSSHAYCYVLLYWSDKQSVSLPCSTPDQLKIISGVPWGFILDPLLFSI